MSKRLKTYLAFDIGGTMIKYGIINEEGRMMENHEIPTEASKGGGSILAKLKQIIQQMQKSNTLSGICIATAGMVDPVEGTILYANDSIPEYSGMELKKILEADCQIPCEVENDVSCAALSEAITGAGRNAKTILCLTIGTGIGGCIIIDREIFHGSSNSAGEVGYMKVFDSDFQKVASTSSLVKKVASQKKCRESELNGRQIFELAKAGDQICKDAIEQLCDTLGYGIANICYVINPEVVILGGGIMGQKEYLYSRIQAGISKYLLDAIGNKTRLEFAENGNLAGMVGAYYNFRSRQQNKRESL